jgi:hypothetical protein
VAGWPVYSHRLLMQATPATWKLWTVPAGYRAVVKSLVVVNGTDTAGKGAQVRLGSGWMLLHNLAARTTVALTAATVCYGGEVLQAWVDIQGITVIVSGYLFADPEHATGPPGVTREISIDRAEPLPAELLA